MTTKAEVRREGIRVETQLAVSIAGGAAGKTRNISASGVFFESDIEMAAGSPVTFSIELESGGALMVLECIGEVVRVEHSNGKLGVAARIVESRLQRKK